MKALEVSAQRTLDLVEKAKPAVTENSVRIKVAYCGICGSDLPRYFDGAVHSFPQVLGHEFSGIVEEIGASVKELMVGDRVSVAPLVPCGYCSNCQKGEPAMCTNYSFIGSREQGAMAEYVVVPVKNCIKVPDNLTLKEAALLEPLTVAIHGVDRLSLHAGIEVLLLGAGTIGLLTLAVLRARGVGKITVVDLNDQKLEVAKILGADEVINPQNQPLEKYYETHALPEAVVETAGSAVTQVQAVKFVKKHGQISYVGTCTKEVVFQPEEFEKILRAEVSIKGAWMSYSAPFPGYEWSTGLRYMAKKEIKVLPLITGVYSLADKDQPFEEMVDVSQNHIKVLYEIAGE